MHKKYPNYSSCPLCFVFRKCSKFGHQSWMILAIIITEFLVAIKFEFETITKPLPQHIAYFWILGFVGK